MPRRFPEALLFNQPPPPGDHSFTALCHALAHTLTDPEESSSSWHLSHTSSSASWHLCINIVQPFPTPSIIENPAHLRAYSLTPHNILMLTCHRSNNAIEFFNPNTLRIHILSTPFRRLQECPTFTHAPTISLLPTNLRAYANYITGMRTV